MTRLSLVVAVRAVGIRGRAGARAGRRRDRPAAGVSRSRRRHGQRARDRRQPGQADRRHRRHAERQRHAAAGAHRSRRPRDLQGPAGRRDREGVGRSTRTRSRSSRASSARATPACASCLSTKPFEAGGGGAPFAGGARHARAAPDERPAACRAGRRAGHDHRAAQLRRLRGSVAAGDVTGPARRLSRRRHRRRPRVATDKDGRASSEPRLKGETSYFAMAELPRNGAVDRLASLPCVLDCAHRRAARAVADKRDFEGSAGRRSRQAREAGSRAGATEGARDAAGRAGVVGARAAGRDRRGRPAPRGRRRRWRPRGARSDGRRRASRSVPGATRHARRTRFTSRSRRRRRRSAARRRQDRARSREDKKVRSMRPGVQTPDGGEIDHERAPTSRSSPRYRERQGAAIGAIRSVEDRRHPRHQRAVGSPGQARSQTSTRRR